MDNIQAMIHKCEVPDTGYRDVRVKAKTYARVSAVLRANGRQFIRAVGSHRNFHKPNTHGF